MVLKDECSGFGLSRRYGEDYLPCRIFSFEPLYLRAMQAKIKICCIASEEEAAMAIHYGANAVGLVARMPSGPGPIADERIASIAKVIPGHIESFLLTSEQSSREIIEHVKQCARHMGFAPIPLSRFLNSYITPATASAVPPLAPFHRTKSIV